MGANSAGYFVGILLLVLSFLAWYGFTTKAKKKFSSEYNRLNGEKEPIICLINNLKKEQKGLLEQIDLAENKKKTMKSTLATLKKSVGEIEDSAFPGKDAYSTECFLYLKKIQEEVDNLKKIASAFERWHFDMSSLIEQNRQVHEKNQGSLWIAGT